MIKKYVIVSITLLTFLFNIVPPAHAYTELKTPVYVTATGTLAGSTIAFAASLIAQGGTTVPTQINFASPNSGLVVTNSTSALKIRGGTNVIGGRVMIYADNASYFTSQEHDPRVKRINPGITPAVYKPTGVDGAGMVGQTEPGYVAALVWGTSTTPNSNATAYTFTADSAGKPTNSVYVVDKGHTFSFVDAGTPTDTQALYRVDGTAVPNVATEGVDSNLNPVALYPQYFGTVGTGSSNDWDLYDKIATDSTRVVVSQQLIKNIATIAYNITPGTGTDAGYYVCQMPNLTTLSDGSDFVTARLGKADGTAGTEIYVNIGGIFTGLPAQVYTTTKLYAAIVQD